MYNGIGLQSARGSGTSGYVQKNLSTNVKKMHNKEQFLRDLEQKRKNNLPPPRKANEQIVQHQKKREIMIQTMKLREKLQAEGLPQEQIQQKVKKVQQNLKHKMQAGKLQTRAKQTHILAQAKQKQYMKLTKAFGVTQKRTIGSAFDFQAQRQQKLKRQYDNSLKHNFECPKQGCGKYYRQKQLLERHLKFKHPELYEQVKELQKEKDRKQLKQKEKDKE